MKERGCLLRSFIAKMCIFMMKYLCNTQKNGNFAAVFGPSSDPNGPKHELTLTT